MDKKQYKIAFFGSSLVSAYWNGAATYYRGIIKALHNLGHHITFFEPDAFERQQHRDIPDPHWANVSIYQSTKEDAERALIQSRDCDIVAKASGVGVLDRYLEAEVLNNRQPGQRVIFWDVDAPATLASMDEGANNILKERIPDFDMVLTYGGGPPVRQAYKSLGARRCIPIYNALDMDTHYRTEKQEKYECDLAFLGNRLPDREERVDSFFFSVAEMLPEKTFLLGGSGWEDKKIPKNVRYVGHVYSKEHNAFNTSPAAVLNINRESMASMGFSPATRIFEAAGAGACLITDEWEGLQRFLEPNKEVLVARNGEEVAEWVNKLTPAKAEAVGQAALERVCSGHTYYHRAQDLERIFNESFSTYNTPAP